MNAHWNVTSLKNPSQSLIWQRFSCYSVSPPLRFGRGCKCYFFAYLKFCMGKKFIISIAKNETQDLSAQCQNLIAWYLLIRREGITEASFLSEYLATGSLTRNKKATFAMRIYRHQRIISAVSTLVCLTQSRARCTLQICVLCKNSTPVVLCLYRLAFVTSNWLLFVGAQRKKCPKYTFLNCPIQRNNPEEDA